MNRREASKKETKRMILKAARTLFARKGMEECTIRDIARKAGVSPASVVVHFKSKTALLEEALCVDIEIALSELVASMPEDIELIDRLLYLSKGFFRLYDKNRDLYRALIRSTVFEPASETLIMSNLSEQYIQFLSHIIEEQKTRGIIRPEVDCRIAAASIFFLYNGALILLLRMPEMTVDMVSDVLASMTDQYLKGITGSHQ
ncbi:MAG: TetR/AcrR family transcriptional regulator [Nitrospirae bacterium]|nr:TetR/AcrR family transcriptional regulator [Nitrospirota bacterium]